MPQNRGRRRRLGVIPSAFIIAPVLLALCLAHETLALGLDSLACFATVPADAAGAAGYQVVQGYGCPAGYSACGTYLQRCSNTTFVGCTSQQVSSQETITRYSCFYNLKACQQVSLLSGAGYSSLSCCATNMCNVPDYLDGWSGASITRHSAWLLGISLLAALLCWLQVA